MIGFRVDANEEIATGHLMRCIAIAAACEKRGEAVLFFLAEKKETERLEAGGFSYEILETDWRNMEEEREKLLPLLDKYPIDWLVVDSYQVTAGYFQLLEQSVRVLYIDDFGRESYDVSALLNYHPWTDEAEISRLYQGRSTELLLGGDYAPLREEFMDCEMVEREQSVLITTGGTDACNVAGKFLRRFAGEDAWKSITFHVIVGSMNCHEEELEALADRYPSIYLHKNISNMGDYMRRCRVAVSAGGTTLYELCACGIPTVCFSVADNQKPGTAAMAEKEVMLYGGDARTDENLCARIGEMVLRLMNDVAEWEVYSARMQKLADGRGALRIAGFLVQSV